MRGAVAFTVLVALAGCGGGGRAAPDATPAWPLPDPGVFDCTAPGVPARASSVPVACALDPTCRTPQVAAHRGAGGLLGILAPEDTLSAYRAGIAIGVDYVETDPRPTLDGVLVNVHDPEVDRTTDGTGLVSDLTLAEVQALHVDAGNLTGDFACERIPTLVEVLQTCRDHVVVLVDANKTDRVDLLVQAIHDAGAVEWAIFDTSSVDKIDQALAIDPALHVMNRPADQAAITTELDHFATHLPVIVELEAADRAAGSAIVHQRGTRSLSDVFLEDAAAIGEPDVSPYGAVVDAGVDILQTDRPDLLLAFLRARGLR